MSRVRENRLFCICENKDADQLRGNRKADQRLCFRYSPLCVGPGRKPRKPVFSQRGSYSADPGKIPDNSKPIQPIEKFYIPGLGATVMHIFVKLQPNF